MFFSRKYGSVRRAAADAASEREREFALADHAAYDPESWHGAH